MLIYVKIIKKLKKNFLFYLNFMIIYVMFLFNVCFLSDRRTDRQIDRQTHFQLKTIVRNLTKKFF